MAYGQWIAMFIKNKLGSGELTVKNPNIRWGKFHKLDNKDNEISASDVDGKIATPDKDADVSACGISDAASGTEGSYDIYDGATKVCYIYWDCPWGSRQNTFYASNIDKAYNVEATGANMSDGGIGKVTIQVTKRG